jgi:hypothetical protein
MAPSWLELVRVLQTPAEAEIAHKDAEDKVTFVRRVRLDDAEEREDAEEQCKGSFVTGTVVETTEVAKRIEKVRLEEAEGGDVGGTKERA